MKPILSYNEYTNTIRQMPQNYLIASFNNGKWTCEPDLAADVKLCVRVFKALMIYENKYCENGLELLANVTPNPSEIVSAWDFVERYYPGYYKCDEIMHHDDLYKLTENEQCEGDTAHSLLMDKYGGDVNNSEITDDYNALSVDIYIQAIYGYLKTE